MATWVVGDVHGCYDEFMALLENKEIKKEDTIILIGDIIDRGPKSLEMIKWAMENITKDGKYQMILGNHEDNVIQDFKFVKRICDQSDTIEEINEPIHRLHCHYGFDSYMEEQGYKTIGDVIDIIDWFMSLPLYKKLTIKKDNGDYQNYVIAHAWFYDKYDSNDDDGDWYRNKILWERDIDDFGDIYELMDYKSDDNAILIHGHTPTIAINDCIKKDKNEVLFREHSINIDCGCVFENYGGNLAAIRLEDHKVIYVREQVKIIP